MIFFWCQGIFFLIFDFKNGCKNEIKDINQKLRIWSRNRVSHKIDFKAEWPRNGHADSVRVKFLFQVLILGLSAEKLERDGNEELFTRHLRRTKFKNSEKFEIFEIQDLPYPTESEKHHSTKRFDIQTLQIK